MNKVSIVVAIKNRLKHFKKIFTSLITQRGVPYELVLVNFYSNDNLTDFIETELKDYQDIYSPELELIKLVEIREDLKFNPRKAKNLGTKNSCGSIIAYSDADVFLSMDYLKYWTNYVEKGKSFVATRIRQTFISDPIRISPEVNYGNCLVHKDDVMKILGWDETIKNYGADDDDFFHRLELIGLKENNPKDYMEARQYSIPHDDKDRLSFLEDPTRCNINTIFKETYSNKNPTSREFNFLKNYQNHSTKTIYAKPIQKKGH